MAKHVLSSDAEIFCIEIVILSIDIIKNMLSLILKSIKYIIEFFIYVFFVYHLFRFYYLYPSFTMLYIYIIILCLVFILFIFSIKFICDYYLLHDFSLYILLPTIFLI